MSLDELKSGIALNVANANVNLLIQNMAALEFKMQELQEELDALKAKPAPAPGS